MSIILERGQVEINKARATTIEKIALERRKYNATRASIAYSNMLQ